MIAVWMLLSWAVGIWTGWLIRVRAQQIKEDTP